MRDLPRFVSGPSRLPGAASGWFWGNWFARHDRGAIESYGLSIAVNHQVSVVDLDKFAQDIGEPPTRNIPCQPNANYYPFTDVLVSQHATTRLPLK